jgi:hypothetical protein
MPIDKEAKQSHQEDLLDEALQETFPASDPISPSVAEIRPDVERPDTKRRRHSTISSSRRPRPSSVRFMHKVGPGSRPD